MNDEKTKELENYFEAIAKNLNISETMRKKAVTSYEAVGNWISDGLDSYDIKIMPQGSFNLGTVIKPVTDTDDYDIDLVCLIKENKNLSAEQVKKIIGTRLKENGTYKDKLDKEGKRCWTLNYEEFHMDILPCVPEHYPFDKKKNSGIKITNKEINDEYNFKGSDPFKYHDWFIWQTKKTKGLTKCFSEEIRAADIDKVPEYNKLTILQKSIQLLKRHRDILYRNNSKNSPISIIITTLASEAYSGEESIFESLSTILNNMDEHIEKINGIYKIQNPVEPKENFADKWNSEPQKVVEFFRWLKSAKKGFLEDPMNIMGVDEISSQMSQYLGENLVQKSFRDVAEQRKVLREDGELYITGLYNTFSQRNGTFVKVENHTFYGN